MEPPALVDTYQNVISANPKVSYTTDNFVLGDYVRVTGASAPISDTDVIAAGLLTIETASSLLSTFKMTMTDHFPFVRVQPQQTTEEIRQQRPFLFLAIIAAASYEDMPLQRKLGKRLKQAISTRMILKGEMSLDLLQGLLVHLAW